MGEAAPKDNSMEEILASIRRIISSDDEAPATGRKAAEENTGKAPPSAPAEKVATAPKEPPVEAQISFRPQASTPTPAEGGAVTLAGLAQQLRGTKELDNPAGKPNALPPETASIQTETIETETGKGALPETAEAVSGDTGEDGADRGNAEVKAPSGAAFTSTTQNLADLAKSINEKIGTASQINSGKPEADPAGDSPEVQAPEAAAEPVTDGLSEPSVEQEVEAAAGETLAGIVETVQKDQKPSTGQDVTADENKTEGDGEAGEVNQSAAGDDGPEAFRQALVSPSTQQAVSGSMDRLKQAASELSSAQVQATLRPLLKEWLDDNLPALVERMVQQEIDRIAAQSSGGEMEKNQQEDTLLQSKSA